MRKHPVTSAIPLAALLLLGGLLAGPLLAYTIYLKDGTSIQSKGKYQISGQRAIIVLVNGTQSFLNANEIDVRRTEEANRVDYGDNAVVLKTPVAPTAPPPPPSKKLSDLIASRGPATQLPPAPRPQERQATATSPASALAGRADLTSTGRKPYAQIDVATDLQQFFRAQGVEELELYQGSRPDRPFLEITTPSEATVFRALSVAANALLHLREAHPGVAAFELLMTTPTRERAGQFVLTPEMAAELAAKKIEESAFFVQNVQF